MKALFVLICSFLITACTTTLAWSDDMKPAPLTPQTIADWDYIGVADLQFSIEGMNYIGTASVSFKVPTTIKINLPKNTSILKIKTCARSAPAIVNPPSGIYEFVYSQRSHLEEGFCLMYIDVLNKDGTLKSAEIDFVDKENMTAFSTCNGVTMQVKGSTICQAPIDKKGRGFLNLVQVAEDVDAIAKPGCAPMKCTAIWCYWLSQPGDCYYRMVGLKSKSVFRLVVRGYLEN